MRATLGIALIAVFFSVLAGVGYLLFGVDRQGSRVSEIAGSTPSVLDTAEGALFTCDGSEALKAVFTDYAVRLTLSDGRSIHVPQTTSASGARYSNPDDSFVFWNKGDTAFVEERGARTYSDCKRVE